MSITVGKWNSLESVGGKILQEFDLENNEIEPSELYKFSCSKVWWKCIKHGHSWQAVVHKRTRRGNNCPYCGNQRPLRGFNTLEDTHPEIAKEFNIEKNNMIPSDVITGSHWSVWWKCSKCENEWQASVKNRIDKASGCPNCTRNGTSYIEQLIYHAIKEQIPETQNKVKLNGYEYDIYIKKLGLAIEYQGIYWHRIKSDRSDREEKKIENAKELAFRLIQIKETTERIAYMDYERLIIYIYHGNIKYKAERILGILSKYMEEELGIKISLEVSNSIKAMAINNSKGIKTENSLAYKYPHLLEEWDYERNEIKPDKIHHGSSEYAFWICKDNHKWSTRIGHRSRLGNGCPICARSKRWETRRKKKRHTTM